MGSPPSTTSSLKILAGALGEQFARHQKEIRIASAAVGLFLLGRTLWGYRAARREEKEAEDAFRPLSPLERFENAMKQVEDKYKDLNDNVESMRAERAVLYASMQDDPEEARGVWRKESCKRQILYDELITKLLIEVDGVGIPKELADGEGGNAARQRRKNLIRELHNLSAVVDELKF